MSKKAISEPSEGSSRTGPKQECAGQRGCERGDSNSHGGVIWKGSRGYRSQYAQVSALLTDQPNLYAGILDRYGIIAVSPQAKEDRGECEGIVYGFAPGGPGEAIVRVVGLGPQDATGDYHMDATTRAYTLVALAGVGAHVDITFELRHGRRWITDLTIRTPP